MNADSNKSSRLWLRILKIAPGIQSLLSYKRSWLGRDIVAGLSVAAIALPVGIAYADLAGVPTVVGMYSAIFPLFAYALFGSSRQLIVGPDTATCLIVAVSLGALAGGDPDRYASLLSVLTLLTALILIVGGFAKLGFMANFLSQPILTGYLNGVGLIILVGQFPKLLGISIDANGFFPEIGIILSSLGQTHLPTVSMGVLILVFMVVTKRIIPTLPGALIAIIGSIVAVKTFSLNQYGITVLGEVSPGLPKFRLPHFEMENLGTLISDAAGIGLVSFTSGVLTSKSFSRRNRYKIDANQELIGFGASNLASWLAQGFPVTGASSRTTVNDAMKGKTQLAGIVAAAAMILILIFLTKPLALVPTVALATVVFVAAFGLLDFKALHEFYAMSQREFYISIATTIGVLLLGVLTGVLLAVSLSLIWLLAIASRPLEGELGRLQLVKGYRKLRDYPEATTIPGLLLYRFDANLIFFNSDYFVSRLRQAIDDAKDPVEWVVLDASPINAIDGTALNGLLDLIEDLEEQGVSFYFARSKTGLRRFFSSEYSRELREKYPSRTFNSLEQAVNVFEKRNKEPEADPT